MVGSINFSTGEKLSVRITDGVVWKDATDIIFSAKSSPRFGEAGELASGEDIELDTVLTEELKEEGILRELIRQFQDIRKKESRRPNEMLVFRVATDTAGKNFIVKHAKEFKKAINAKSIIISGLVEGGREAKADNLNFRVKIENN